MRKMTSTEAPRSVNFYGVSTKGWNLQFTIRSVDNESLLKELGDLINRVEALGVVPKAVGQQPSNVSHDTAPPPPPTSAPPPVHEVAYDTFEAAELEGSTRGDKTYWKVKGGKFSKYGVTIWPEVLEEAGFNVNDLDPATVYSLAGYTARYVTKEDGKPDKVIKLEQ